MDSLFAILFLASVGGLAWGLASPRRFSNLLRIPRVLTRLHVGLIMGGVTLLFFILTGVTAPPQQPASAHKPESQSLQATAQAPQQTVVTTKQTVETKSVPFATTYQSDSSLPEGQTKTIQVGVNGIETFTYKATYTNGTQTDKTLISDVVTTKPTNEIIANGTYVAPMPSPSCYPLTNGGNCYEPGEYCRNSDHGAYGVAGNGEAIVCAYNNGWRWEPR